MKTYFAIKAYNDSLPVKTYTSADFKRWGAQGGAKSKRVLTAAQAKAMVAAREKKRRKTKQANRRNQKL